MAAATPAQAPTLRDDDLDRERLREWLRNNIAAYRDGPLAIERFEGGQSNPTYRIGVGERQIVLRRRPSGPLLPSAHAVDREYRVMSAVANAGVPVPKMLGFCDDPSVIGTAFFVMTYVEGRIFWDPTLPGLSAEARAVHYDALNGVIAKLHRVDYQSIGLADFGKPGNYMARQVARWSRQYASAIAPRIAAMDALIEWLPSHIPDADDTALVHGDFRVDNVIFHPSQPRIVAVLDWELATLGHPLSDFAYHVMAWRLTPHEFRGLRGLDLGRLGIPSESEYVAAYCARTGRHDIAHWEVYLIFNMFRIAAILHGVLSRALQGNAANRNALETGAGARLVADVAWRMAQQHRDGD